jgi:hypothetical protein
MHRKILGGKPVRLSHVMNALRCCFLVFASAAAIAVDGAVDDADTADKPALHEIEQKMADSERAAAISAASDTIKSLESDLKLAQSRRDAARAKALRLQITAHKKELVQLRKKSDEYFLEQAREKLRAESAIAEREQALKVKEQRLKAAGPVVITRMGINYNVINVPELTLVVQNTDDLTVDAFEICAECFNKFDEPVTFPGRSNVFNGTSQLRIEPKETKKVKWQLSLQQNTTRADVWVSRVKLQDGRVITVTKEEAQNKPFGVAKAELME